MYAIGKIDAVRNSFGQFRVDIHTDAESDELETYVLDEDGNDGAHLTLHDHGLFEYEPGGQVCKLVDPNTLTRKQEKTT